MVAVVTDIGVGEGDRAPSIAVALIAPVALGGDIIRSVLVGMRLSNLCDLLLNKLAS
ncbi:hypothetical protein ACN4EK_28135 [Pantanalinema rosaneae CENA516]|uniref:hypothetical protein n=1 Tax=Pantanalinema rosaneae TaxID=1620701 RepID=UPI003D6F46DD